jgi:LPPG:FO 2-phospho-L-lactate transferase
MLSPGFGQALDDPELAVVLICPSNPFVSVDPILALPGIQDRLQRHKAPVIAVSPIVANKAIKGPTAKMMQELGLELSALGVYRHYGDLLDGFVLDEQDRRLINDVQEPRQLHCCNTIMDSMDDRITLARECLLYAAVLV